MISKLHSVAIEEGADGYRAICEDCRWTTPAIASRAAAETSAEGHTAEAPRLTGAADVAPAAAGARHNRGAMLKGSAHVAPPYYLTNEGDVVAREVRVERRPAAEAAAAYAADALRLGATNFNPALGRLYARIAFRFAALASPWSLCAVCDQPFDHSCNGTAACSLECEDAAWNSPDRALYYPDEAEDARA